MEQALLLLFLVPLNAAAAESTLEGSPPVRPAVSYPAFIAGMDVFEQLMASGATKEGTR